MRRFGLRTTAGTLVAEVESTVDGQAVELYRTDSGWARGAMVGAYDVGPKVCPEAACVVALCWADLALDPDDETPIWALPSAQEVECS